MLDPAESADMGMPPFLTSPIALRLLQTFQRLLLAVIYQRFLNNTNQGKASIPQTLSLMTAVWF